MVADWPVGQTSVCVGLCVRVCVFVCVVFVCVRACVDARVYPLLSPPTANASLCCLDVAASVVRLFRTHPFRKTEVGCMPSTTAMTCHLPRGCG
jgi:hypothetical protein